MTLDPKEAYEAAKKQRDKNEQARSAREMRQRELPALAESQLHQIVASMRESLPPELRLDAQFNSAGSMKTRTRDGIKGVYIRLFEGDTLIAEGSIGIASDESVVFGDYTKDPKVGKGIVFKEISFSDLSVNDGVAFISHLIKLHVR